MLPAFLTTFFFGLSVIFAARSAKQIGGANANFGRMVVATILLATYGEIWGVGLHGPALRWFILSGCVGFGLGDIALFEALPRIGPRLTVLLTQCLAAPLAALGEWAWLGSAPTLAQLGWSLVILAGVGLALAPDRHLEISRGRLITGTMFGVCAAVGQAAGAVISRAGYRVAEAGHFAMDGGSAAYQRTIGGLAITGLFFAGMKLWEKRPMTAARSQRAAIDWRLGALWIGLNALAGPALGVGCYQWALQSTQTAIVLPIVATTPVVAMALAFFIEGDRPARRAVTGGLVAVAGTIGLALS